MTSIPIFPLKTVLYPGSLLPLKIFEQRYLDMTKTCIRDAEPFGVCLIREGREVGLPAVPEPVGCTAVISEWEMPQLGVFHLKALGAQPFRMLHLTTQTDGLIRADIEMLAESTGTVAPASFALCRNVLETPYDAFGEIRLDKWKDGRNREKVERMLPKVAAVARAMGYSIDGGLPK